MTDDRYPLSHEERLRELEEFKNQIEGGRKGLLYFFYGLGGCIAAVWSLIEIYQALHKG